MIFATENIFNNEETNKVFLERVEEIVQAAKDRGEELIDGQVWDAQNMVQGDGVIKDEKRRSKILWIRDKAIRYEVCDFVLNWNAENLHFDLFPFSCEIQYAEYHAADKGHFDWHWDQDPWQNNLRKYRKYSATMQLSNQGEDYEGGNLEFRDVTLDPRYKKKGSFVLFPSPVPHRVTPVTSGVRKSLVFWFHGPQFK